MTGTPPSRAGIAVVGLRGLPNVMGGIETHCEQLYPRIAKLDATSIGVFARQPYMDGREEFTYRGVQVIPIWAVRNKYLEAILHTGWAIFLARFRRRVDIVHIHGVGPALWAPMARLLGFKVVVTHHGKDYDRAKWNTFARFILRSGEWIGLQCSNSVIVVDNAFCEALKRAYPKAAARLTHIPNGGNHFDAADQTASGSVLDELGIRAGGYILAVGRLVPEKGFDDLIAAARRLGDRVLPLVIVGSSDHEDAFSRGLVAQAGQGVIFAGYQPRSRLKELYEKAALFVSPSHHEGNPIAPLEAISLGAAVLLSDIEPHRELGLAPHHYFRVGDIDGLADGLLQPAGAFVVQDETIRLNFDWDRSAAKTAAIYRSLLEPADPTTAR